MSVVIPASSFCPGCKNNIKWHDNIPVLSFLMLGGKCRSCSAKISIRYPIVELLTALLFILFFLKFGLEKIYFFYIILVGYLIVLTFIDIDKKEVPDEVIVFLFLTGFILDTLELNNGINIFSGLAGCIAAGFVFYAMNYFTDGKIGEGDVKLIAALGLCLGLKNISLLILWSFIIGGAAAFILLVSGNSRRTDKIAFVPFIMAAFLLQGMMS
jgi:leader peptidase (prepilin peptidase)/N-methyltransferase